MGPNAKPDGGFVIRNVDRQTLGFQLPNLPGNEFRIAVPELLSDADEPILPWGFVSPEFEIRDNAARLAIDLPGLVRMKVQVHFAEDRIQVRVITTNRSHRTWKLFNPFTCFASYKAPSFHDPEGMRTYFPVEGKWTSVVELRSRYDPGNGPFTFLPVAGGPVLNDLWVCRQLQGHCTGPASQNCACVVSADGSWVAGVTTRKAAYLFNNRKLTCLHTAPLVESVSPGAGCEAVSTIFILRATTDELAQKRRPAAGEFLPGSGEFRRPLPD